MNQRLKSVLLYLIEPRSIILLVALFNFVLIWTVAQQRSMLGITCTACPWYFPWYWDNEATQVLIAAIILRLHRFGSVIALLITGHLLSNLGYYFVVHPDSFYYYGLLVRRVTSEPFNVLSWHGQYLFVLIIFCCSILYMTKIIILAIASRHTADNKRLERTRR